MNRRINKKRLLQGLIMVFMSFYSVIAFAQERQLSGTITDATGETMIGVNVLVKGTTNGTITDFNGEYSLEKVSSKDVLVISYIGYITQEIPAGNNSKLNIVLKEDSQALDEVVVVGYGVQKKSDLTGAISSVSSERIAAIGSSSVMGALQGSTPGVDISTSSARPGGSFKIQVRGQNTMEDKKTSPLYVVDGIIVGDIDFLNPSDIERIDVLKDASSTAIYGSRGSNGVVIVKTKGAAIGGSRLNVSYDGYYGVRKVARIPDFMDGREWTDYRTSRYYGWNAKDETYTLTDANKTAVTQNSKKVHNALYNEEYEDWLGLGTQDGSQQNHYVNIVGSTQDMSYSVSAGFQNEVGNFLMEELERYVLKGTIDHKANKFFSVGASFSLSHQNVNGGSQYGYRDLLRIPNVLSAYDETGRLIPQPGIKAEIDGVGNFTSAANPLIEIQSGTSQTRRFDILSSVYAQITPIENLTIKTTLSPRYNRTRGGYFRDANANRTNNQAQNDNAETLEWTWDNVVNYSKTFNQAHNLNATLINSFYKTQKETIVVASEKLPYNSEWYNVTSGTYIPANSSSGYSQTTLLSYAGRLNYDYRGKYLATATVRYDGSSKLADKWDVFPSAALAWRLSEEDFIDANWLSNLKLRASLGYSGNNNIDPYSYTQSPNTKETVYYDFGGTPMSGFAVGAPVNIGLTWEKTREWNFGVDFGFFDGRINGAVDLYDKLSDHLLMKRLLSIESGVASMTDNIGSVNNRGVEILLNTLNVNTRDWRWETTFTFAHNKNAIRSLYGKKEDVISEARFIGQPINVIYDYKVNGVYGQSEWAAMSAEQRKNMGALYPGTAKAVDANGDGKMSTEDRVILGSPDPDWTFGISSNLSYKNFDFSFNIYGRQGVFLNDKFLEEFGVAANSQRGRPKVKQDYYIPANTPRYDWSQFNIDANGQAWAVWGNSVENPNAKYPVNSLTGDFYGSNGRYQDASFIKVRNITVGYTLPKSWSQKAYLSYARIYFNVLNPFTITDYVGWDPEYATTNLHDGNGPSAVTYQFGVNLKF